MSDIQLLDGSPVPEDRSHTKIDPKTGMQQNYIVLSPEERAKGFVKPLRRSYTHLSCGHTTTMGLALCETYARDPYFYSGTFCANCCAHFDLSEFLWCDGEPMDPLLQEDWAKKQAELAEQRKQARIKQLTDELAQLQGKAP